MSFVDELDAKKNDIEQIALIAMSCRFPGDVNTPIDFMKFLLAGGDGIVIVPNDRWDHVAYFDEDKEKKNRMYVNQGGFIRDIDLFEPQFFGISPKEAPAIDPQHRWLLELTYEAFENAGLKTSQLRGSNTAVYIGQFMHDYEQLQVDSMAHQLMSSHSATGPSMTLTANRISYTFDFTGPSVALDTACSSSLVALDMACQAIIRGDSDMAIAGGVNILLRPEMTMSICKASMLSPDGRCKSFDASANGYVRSEGAGVVIVKKYSDAVRDGDPILAIIKATGVNQDGQTKGITVPNGNAQKNLLHTSLKRANFKPQDIQYIEAHGTGTAVGDPIEVNAMGSVLKERYEGDEQCILGSVKSNIGHTEAAAGMAGLMKTVLAMNAGVIPRNINFKRINPAINLQNLNLNLAIENTPWPQKQNNLRTAVVNSFGFGGTNANAIIQQAPGINPLAQTFTDVQVSDTARTYWLPLSAKNETALISLAQKYIEFLKNNINSVTLNDICYTASLRREHYKHRLVVSGENKQELIAALNKFVSREVSNDYVAGSEIPELDNKELGNNLTFVFSGMGTQWVGMGRELYAVEPVFKQAIDKCDAALAPLTGWSLADKLYHNPEPELSNRTDLAQPAIFAVQVALAELLASWNILPARIVGHSAGEVAAAFVAGALTFDSAIQVIYHRSRLQYLTEGSGKMLAVGLTENALQSYLKGYENSVSIAAINSEDAITLAGDEEHLKNIAEKLDADGFFNKFLSVSVPYHSPVMDQLKAPLIEALAGMVVREPMTPLYSTVTGKALGKEGWGPEYWTDNVRNPVLFKTAIDQMLQDGARCFVEIAAHPALASSIEKCFKKQAISGALVTCLKRDMDGEVMIRRVIGQLHVVGIDLQWANFYREGRHTLLPNYQWQRASYWLEAETVRHARLNNISPSAGLVTETHILLGSALPSQVPMWQKSLSLQDIPFLSDHRVEGEVVYPAAAYIDMGLALGAHFDATKSLELAPITLENLVFHRAFFLNENIDTRIETTLDLSGRYKISAIDPQTNLWNFYSEGRICSTAAPNLKNKIDLDSIRSRLSNHYDNNQFYSHCANLGLNYLDRFQAVKQAWFSADESLVELHLPDDLGLQHDLHLLHPVMLDGAFQSLFPTINSGFLPVSIRQLRYHQKPTLNGFAHLITHFKDDKEIYGDIVIADQLGDVIVEVLGISLKATNTQRETINGLLYEFRWQEQAIENIQAFAKEDPAGKWLIISDSNGAAKKLVNLLKERSYQVELLEPVVNQDWLPLLTNYASTCVGIVDFSALDQSLSATASTAEVAASVERSSLSALHFVQSLTQVEWRNPVALVMVTERTQPVYRDELMIELAQASLWGFGRVVASEHPELAVTIIDLDSATFESSIEFIANELSNNNYEQEVAIRNGIRYVNRLDRITKNDLESYANRSIKLIENENFQLANNDRTLVKLAKVSPPDINDIVIKVHYATIGSSGWGLANLYVCAGHIIAKGEAVTGLNIDDEIITVSASVSAEFLVSAETVALKPEGISLRDACIKASSSLSTFANIDSILLTNSAGSVAYVGDIDIGSAALLNAAASSGKNVKACIAHPELFSEQLFGCELIDTGFYDWPELTGSSKSIDVLINAGINPLDLRLLTRVKQFGTIIDWSNEQLDSWSLGLLATNHVRYTRMSWLELLSQKSALLGKYLQLALINNGELNRFESIKNIQSFTLAQWLESSSAYVASHNLSAVLLEIQPEVDRQLNALQGEKLTVINPERSYLVTGGLGGLGLTMMDWLVSQGATSIALTGRSAPNILAQERIQHARAQGVNVAVIQADISSYEQVVELILQINSTMLPLAGIIHSAGVLDDGVIGTQTAEKFFRVFAPKISGTWNLHLASENLPIEMFVCFSSIASIVGWSGQANYAAANSFMDAFCHYRQRMGKPALSINWGPWAEAGMAANLDTKDIERMNDSGMLALKSSEGINAMHELLRFNVPQSGVFNVEWNKILKTYRNAARKTLLGHFMEGSGDLVVEDFKQELLSLDKSEREQLLLVRVKTILAEVIGLSGFEQIDSAANVFEYGMNSLMAVEIKIKLQSALSLNLPTTLVLKYPTAMAMTSAILNLLKTQQGESIPDNNNLPIQENNPLVSIPVFSDDKKTPLSFSQLRLWLLDQIAENSLNYHLVKIFSLKGTFNVNAYKQAWNDLIARHKVLCTIIAVDEQHQPYQLIAPPTELSIKQEDLTSYDVTQQTIELNNIVSREASLSFDFANDLMLRCVLVKLHDDEYISLNIIHHIAADGWSLRIILNEFSEGYSAYCNDRQPDYAPLPITYKDYARWQHDLVEKHLFDAQMNYWKNQLHGAPSIHNLPLSFSRPVIQTINGSVYRSSINQEILGNLKACCQHEGATLFMGLWAAFSVLLARYSNERDILVGSPVANREHADLAGLVGFFVNTIVFRVEIENDFNFNQLLQLCKNTALDAFANQQVPFEALVDELVDNRDTSHSPLVQIMFALQNNVQGNLQLPLLDVQEIPYQERYSKNDLSLNAFESVDGLRLDWEYNNDLFDADLIEKMANSFTLLLAALVQSPAENVFKANMLSDAEHHQIMEWNNTQADYRAEKCIHELFEERALQYPHAVAALFENQQLTYAELNSQANQLAHYLVNEKQIKPDTLVGICIERSLEMVIAILGILKAGGAYVPLDPDYPEARLAYMLKDANVTTVITQSLLLNRTPISTEQALCLDDKYIQQQLAQQATTNITPQSLALHSQHLAYVIYTSGSTGNPKGVMVEHHALVNRIDWMDRQYGSSPTDKILQKTPFSFDVSVWEFVWPLTVGASIVLAKPEGHKDPVYLAELIQSQKITKLHFVPSMLSSMLSLGDLSACTSLQQVFCSGEALSLQHVQDFASRCSTAELHNLYGPTEAAIDVSYWDCSQYHNNLSSVPIGRPIHNIQLYVCNAQLELSPQGAPGELLIGGVGLARGYLNRLDLTAEKFIVNPFYDKNNANSSERLYKTGDLVRWLPDGNLEFLGRIDHQVKIRGFRIELGEIENALTTHNRVKDAIVLAKNSATGDKRLVGYVAIGSGIENDNSDGSVANIIKSLRQHLHETLPDYMVPSAFVVLDAMPLTPNGKVDRKALPEPDMQQHQKEYIAPRNETEKLLCEIWQSVLEAERVGVTDNFFEIGGHSLLATRLLTKINQQFDTNFALKEVFSLQTIELMAPRIINDEIISEIQLNKSEALSVNEMELMV